MTKIIITDGQTDAILDRINAEDVVFNDHERDKSIMLETFKFTVFADRRYAEHLNDRNRVVIPGEDGEYREFVIKFTDINRDSDGINLIEVTALASFQELIGAKIIRPGTTTAQTAEAHARGILAGTEVEVGEVAYTGVRTIIRENYTDPFSALKSLAREFDLELDFRVEVDTNRITKRYADLVERVGEWRGRYAEFGKDLLGIRRIEDTSEIVTAILCLGPVREDGTRLEVFVEDRDALARWGRRGQHIVAVYEPQSEDSDMAEERLITLGQTELKKRINAIIDYEIDVVDLEHVPGMEHKKIRFGDTIRIKDSTFNPPLFVEARIYKQNRNIFNPASKKVVLGDYVEYTVDEIRDNWNAIREEIDRKVKEAEKRAELIAIIGDIRFTIIGYKEPLKAQKSSIDSQYTSLVNNLDLDSSIRSNLATIKSTYDNAYGVLLDTIDNTAEKEELTENDLQYVNRQYASYESGMAELTELFELATDSIAKKKADDAEDGANRYTDEHLVDITEILERAEGKIDQAIIDIGGAQREILEADRRINELQRELQLVTTNIGDAQKSIDDAINDLNTLENDLNSIANSGSNLVPNSKGDSFEGWRLWTTSSGSVITFDNSKWLRIYNTNITGGVSNTAIHTPIFNMKANKTYVVSFTIKSYYNSGYDLNYVYLRNGQTSSIKRLPNVNMRSSNFVGDISGDGLRVWFTFSHDSDVTASLLLGAGLSDGAGFAIKELMINEGTVPMAWEPSPEDKLDVGQAANDVNNGSTRILGKNIIIDGDALVTGNISARQATFLDMTTRNMTAINAIMQDATITGSIGANNATFIQGVFNEITANSAILNDATITGSIGASQATFLGMATRDMTAINATIQNSTITGTLTAANARFLQGTFERATIVDATIRDATITGNMTAGSISGVTITGGSVVGSWIRTHEDIEIGERLYFGFGGELSNTSTWIGRKWTGTGANNYRLELSSDISVDINSPFMHVPNNRISFGSNIDVDTRLNRFVINKSNNLLASFSTVETANHGFFRMGGVALKFLSSGDSLQVRNSADTAYLPIRASAFNPPNSSFTTKKNIGVYSDNALERLRQMELYTFNYNEEKDVDPLHLGVMVEESPDIILNSTKETIDLYSLIGFNLKAIKDLDKSVQDELNWLKTENQYLKNEIAKLKEKIA